MHYWVCEEVVTRVKSFVCLLQPTYCRAEFVMSVPGESLISASIDQFQ